MKINKLLLSVLAGIVVCGVFAFTAGTKVQASSYFPVTHYRTYTPRSWRGTYKTSSGSTMKVNTYSVSYNGKTYYKSSWSGWRKLAFARVDSTHYTFNALAKYGYQSSRRWRLKYKNGKKELINSQIMGAVTVWHQYVFKRPKFKVADSTNFFYNAWRSAYLSEFSTIDLHHTIAETKDDSGSTITIENPHTHFYARWLAKNEKGNILKIKYHGKTYYGDNQGHSLVPYNAKNTIGQISSYFKPTSKAIILKKGTIIHPGMSWAYWYHNGEKVAFYKYTGTYWKRD